MSSEKTKEYIVIKPNTLNHWVGDVIELTEKRAGKLEGKVRLKSEGAADLAKRELPSKIIEENTKLKAEMELLEDSLEDLEKQIYAQEKEIAVLKKAAK